MSKLTVQVDIAPLEIPEKLSAVIAGTKFEIPLTDIEPTALVALADDWRSRLFTAAAQNDPTLPIKRERKPRAAKTKPDQPTPEPAKEPDTTTQPALADVGGQVDPDWLTDDSPTGPRDDEAADAFKTKAE